MTNKIKIQSLVENHLPSFVLEENQTFIDFLKQYYVSQEFKSSASDIINNLTDYIKPDKNYKEIINPDTELKSDVGIIDSTIEVVSTKSWPEKYGLLKIGDEIITYTSKDDTHFYGCVRGFSGVTEYSDTVFFESSNADVHNTSSIVTNLSILFLQIFFSKIKKQYLYGFDGRSFYEGLDQSLFLKQSKDFYSSKGTDRSFEILFRALFGKDVSIIKPKDYLIRPSSSDFNYTKDLLVSSINGNILNLKGKTIYQDKDDNFNLLKEAYGSVKNIEEIYINGSYYYKISLDFGYDRDIPVVGTVFGDFQSVGYTKVTLPSLINSNTLTVDSTIAFPNSGSIIINENLEVTYTSKTNTEFLGCTGINENIPAGSTIRYNSTSYGFDDSNQKIEFRIISVLSKVTNINDAYGLSVNDPIEVSYPGIVSKNDNPKFNSWLYNVSFTSNIDTIEIENNSEKIYKIKTFDKHTLLKQDKIVLTNIQNNAEYENINVFDVLNEYSFLCIIPTFDNSKIDNSYKLRRIISKPTSSHFSEVQNYNTDVQNTYALNKDCYIFSNSLPKEISSKESLVDLSVDRFSSGISTSIITFYDSSENKDHGFYTGELIDYVPGTYDFLRYNNSDQLVGEEQELSINNTISGLSSGSYYVKRINGSQISLYKSKSDIYSDSPISLGSIGIVTSNLIVRYPTFYKKYENLTPQKFYKTNTKGKTLIGSQRVKRLSDRKLSIGKDKNINYSKIGTFINGVDAISYKSNDKIYYGKIESINVISGGEDYDIINPPNISVSDASGSGFACSPVISGNLKEIYVEYGGLNYKDTPIIEIKGGNGNGANAKANMHLIDNIVYFDASTAVNTSTNSITFTNDHNFIDGEQVVYENISGDSIGIGSFNLVNYGLYYVKVIDPKTIKVSNTLADVLSGNFLNITSSGNGTQKFKSFIRRKSIKSISILSSGSGYENKKRVISESGINTSTNTFYYKNHGFGDGEQITYRTTGTEISGLSTSTTYYLSKIDDNNFRLSEEYGGNNKLFYFETKQYVNINDVGSGQHEFNYPPITVNVIGNSGIGTFVGDGFDAIIHPKFLGSIKEISIENGGVGYGSSDIINFEKTPSIEINNGSGAYLRPLILNGSIVDVAVLNGGSGYTSKPDLVVYGNGSYAKLIPVVQNGSITSVKISGGGINYSQDKTTIEVIPLGKNAKLQPKLQEWTINIFEKIKSNISDDDGYVYPIDSELNFGYMYAPRSLRSILYQSNSNGESDYSSTDFDLDTSTKKPLHSPILGWAYDGNPIYGPYGYSNASGGTPKLLRSGYELIPSNDRPPFKNGFFVEDYVFTENGDLDEHNGRFCITPEYPNGTYAYFTTINPDSISSDGPFKKQRSPHFPYIVGNRFKDYPDDFNLDDKHQNDIDINASGLIRTTHPYKINLTNSEYEFFEVPFKNQREKSNVNSLRSGKVEFINIEYGGDGYKSGDTINFDNQNTGGSGASAKVEYIEGKDIISLATTSITINDAQLNLKNSQGDIEVTTDLPHNLLDNDFIFLSGISTLNETYSKLEGSHKISVNSKKFNLITGIGTSGVTGLVTFINLNGNIASLQINDILGIGTEQVRVLNVDVENSRVRIERDYLNTGIVTSHNSSSVVTEIPRTFNFSSNVGLFTGLNNRKNKIYYFDPQSSVGIGTTTYDLTVTSAGLNTSIIKLDARTIYLPNHGYVTGQKLIYSNGGDQSIGVSTAGISTFLLSNNSIVYAARFTKDILGISTNPVGLATDNSFVGIGSTSTGLLYFNDFGSGKKHSFTSTFNQTTAIITKSVTTVTTETLHELNSGDEIILSVLPTGINTSYVVEYNDYNQRICINPFTISSSGINTETNLITRYNHNLITGSKVIYESSSAALPLSNNKIYYVKKYNNDSFYLYDSYHNLSTNTPINLISSGGALHKFSSINPKINLYNGNVVDFDLSSSTLSEQDTNTLTGINTVSSFTFKLFLDENFNEEYVISDKDLEVVESGLIGISSDARVRITASNNIPNELYYNLIPRYYSSKKVYSDSEIASNNLLTISNSSYNKNYKVIAGISSQFTIINDIEVESNFYDSQNSSLSYYTNSRNVNGPIKQINLISGGSGYKSLPSISSITSTNGTGAILQVKSESIGKVGKLVNNSLGYEYSSDKSLRPAANAPKLYRIQQLSSVSSVGVSSGGKNYTLPPNLIVVDRVTKKENKNIDLECIISGSSISKVNVISKDYTLYDTNPIIFPQNNTNGIGITYISYNSSTNKSTITLNTGFSDPGSFPFSANQKILVENVGIASTGSGYNSSDYGYQYFTISSVSENLGGLGTITFDMPYGTTNPGTYSTANSYGTVVPENLLPIFEPEIEVNSFLENEEIQSFDGQISNVVSWDDKNKILKVIGNDNSAIGDFIVGKTSFARGILLEKIVFDLRYELNSYENSSLPTWNDNIGFLNANDQVIPDNFYYQNFSYSLKSEIPYQEWNDSVSSLVHTSGFKKFSDLQIENFTNVSDKNFVTQNESNLIVDLVSEVDLNCIEDYDFAYEKTINVNNVSLSKEIVFENRILTDYIKSISNIALAIDDIGISFNSFPRPTPYTVADSFDLDFTYNKYILVIEDSVFYGEKEIVVSSFIQENGNSWMSTYGLVETVLDLGYFDFSISGTKGQLLFYPTKYEFNNYNIKKYAYRIKHPTVGVASTSIGDIVSIGSTFKYISPSITPSQTTLFSISTSSYTSSKLIVSLESDNQDLKYQVNEISLTTNGIVEDYVDYGQLNSSSSIFVVGLGTFSSSLSSGNLNLDFTPISGVGITANILYTNFAGAGITGVGSTTLDYVKIDSFHTSISSSPSPSENVISSFNMDDYQGAYYMVNIIDTTNNETEFFELLSVHDTTNTYLTKYGTIQTNGNIGTVGMSTSGSNVILTYTPASNIDVEVSVLQHSIGEDLSGIESIDLSSSLINSSSSNYRGTNSDIRRSFDLYHKSNPIFEKAIDASTSIDIDLVEDSILVPNHYFVTGEEIKYTPFDSDTSNSIGIATTSFAGIGITNILPTTLYVIKEGDARVKLAGSAEDALAEPPRNIDLTSLGIGTLHRFTSKKQDTKCLVTIDNNIQSPLVATGTTTTLSLDLTSFSSIIVLDNSENLYSTDLIRIDDEYMKISSVGYGGSTNTILVDRAWMGSLNASHTSGSLVRKYEGNYTIIDNTINFIDPPYGNTPQVTDKPDEKDWTGIQTSSSFSGRVFLRNASIGSTLPAYTNNYIFDDISSEFDGNKETFSLKSNLSDITDVAPNNGVILINEIFQSPGLSENYTLSENVGITSISFVGLGVSVPYDINTSSLPRGGIIVSVGSSSGFGYQNLVSAGGTAIVYTAGTIQSISIGNSGSGYRSGIQTNVNVSIAKTDISGITTYINIGIASILNGSISSVEIINPGSGYTTTNPPLVFFDEPLSYSNIPLTYASGNSGLGTEAKVNIVVGSGSSVINFEIQNFGYNYSIGDVLTVPIGGSVGIPTLPSGVNEFTISVEKVFNDKFSGWTFGQLQLLDNISDQFDGSLKSFDLYLNNSPLSLVSDSGSLISLENNLLVFINDILQVPGKSYTFNGGSVINFTEAPKGPIDNVPGSGDTASILFYRGSNADSSLVDVLETIKVGDLVRLNDMPEINIKDYWQQKDRLVTRILNVDKIETNSYTNPGVSTDTTFTRPLTWCKQKNDIVISGINVTKDRFEYEPSVIPTTRLINPISTGTTQIYVENTIPIFYSKIENLSTNSSLTIIDINSKVAASATSIVSISGTISSFVISDGGVGYTTAPKVSIYSTVGSGSSAVAVVGAAGTIVSIDVVQAGSGYTFTSPPLVMIESNPRVSETLSSPTYYGDYGSIVGVGTTSIVGVAYTGLYFDLFVPLNSPLRNSDVVFSPITMSGISTNDFIVINNTDIGNSVVSIGTDGQVIGIGTTCLDNIYQVAKSEQVVSIVPGVGSTTVNRITTNISDYNQFVGLGTTSYYGEYSWGRIDVTTRSTTSHSYSVGLNSGLSGLSTSPIIVRNLPLKYFDYNT
jgi:hypothetical protein